MTPPPFDDPHEYTDSPRALSPMSPCDAVVREVIHETSHYPSIVDIAAPVPECIAQSLGCGRVLRGYGWERSRGLWWPPGTAPPRGRAATERSEGRMLPPLADGVGDLTTHVGASRVKPHLPWIVWTALRAFGADGSGAKPDVQMTGRDGAIASVMGRDLHLWRCPEGAVQMRLGTMVPDSLTPGPTLEEEIEDTVGVTLYKKFSAARRQPTPSNELALIWPDEDEKWLAPRPTPTEQPGATAQDVGGNEAALEGREEAPGSDAFGGDSDYAYASDPLLEVYPWRADDVNWVTVLEIELARAKRWIAADPVLGTIALMGPINSRRWQSVKSRQVEGYMNEYNCLTLAGWWKLAYLAEQGVGWVERQRARTLVIGSHLRQQELKVRRREQGRPSTRAGATFRPVHLRHVQDLCFELMKAGATPLGVEWSGLALAIQRWGQGFGQGYRPDALLVDEDGSLIWLEYNRRPISRSNKAQVLKYQRLEKDLLLIAARVKRVVRYIEVSGQVRRELFFELGNKSALRRAE